MKIKLLTLWIGELPPWIDKFRERMAAQRCVDWELIQPPSVEWMNRMVSAKLDAPCCKESAYALCDLRPMYLELFADRCASHEWWGWCDLDVVLGDLDTLLLPLTEDNVAISTCAGSVHGPMSVFRNSLSVRRLYLKADYRSILAEPKYLNFDETGFAVTGENPNESFTKLIKDDGMLFHCDDRSWTESFMPLPDGSPSRGCVLDGGSLYETPTETELMLYHFTSKLWPVGRDQDLWSERLRHYRSRMPAPTPSAESPEFWAERVRDVLKNGRPLHVTAYDCPKEEWERLQEQTRRILSMNVKPNDSVLDVGCGAGWLLDVLDPSALYVGIDYCREMIDLAKRERGARAVFRWMDVRRIPESWETKYDWCVCRGIEGSAIASLGTVEWERMLKEMKRMAKRVLLIDMAGNWRVVE